MQEGNCDGDKWWEGKDEWEEEKSIMIIVTAITLMMIYMLVCTDVLLKISVYFSLSLAYPLECQ